MGAEDLQLLATEGDSNKSIALCQSPYANFARQSESTRKFQRPLGTFSKETRIDFEVGV